MGPSLSCLDPAPPARIETSPLPHLRQNDSDPARGNRRLEAMAKLCSSPSDVRNRPACPLQPPPIRLSPLFPFFVLSGHSLSPPCTLSLEIDTPPRRRSCPPCSEAGRTKKTINAPITSSTRSRRCLSRGRRGRTQAQAQVRAPAPIARTSRRPRPISRWPLNHARHLTTVQHGCPRPRSYTRPRAM